MGLNLRPVACASTFVIGKKGKDTQREIWNGSAITEGALEPPKPPYQANSAALTQLEASRERPPRVSGRDATTFFDQVMLPITLQAFTGQPYILLSELLNGVSGMTRDEVARHVWDGALPLGDCELTPVSLAWPMGFVRYSCVAQSYMVACCREAGVDFGQLITEEGHLPVAGQPAVSVATDDVLHYLRGSPEEVAHLRELPLSSLDAVWEARGLRRNVGKTYDLQPEATALGIRFC